MLVKFRFKNYKSFKDEAVFDMRAIKSYKEHTYNVSGFDTKDPILKVATIYGANASGKSNFISAYGSFLQIVNRSFVAKETLVEKSEESTKPLLANEFTPYLFSADTARADIEFEGIFHEDGFEYKYGFSFNATRIKYEWLYRKPIGSGRFTKILERTPNKIELGASVKNACEKYKTDIADNCLALSFYSSLKLKTQIFTEVYECVMTIFPIKLSTDAGVGSLIDFYFKKSFDEEEKVALLKFLSAIDIDIKDISREDFNNDYIIYTYHKDSTGKLKRVPFEIESDGTRKAIAVYTIIRLAVLTGCGLMIDELNSQLHPLLLKYLVDLFYQEGTQGQLIYTTHSTALLDKRYLRRDQIWFVEKQDGASSLYSLAEFKPRNDATFEKEYLSGAFGGVPILRDFVIGVSEDGK